MPPPDDSEALPHFDRRRGSYLANERIDSIVRKGLFEGELTSLEIQELCGAILAEIAFLNGIG